MVGSIAGRMAEDPKEGMTLDELAAFVQLALRMELPGNTRIKAKLGWKQQLQAVSTKG
jgi:hypothetical protein